ncbi:MAG: aminopeptidase P family N-terminal domain-containing protein, partial [Bacteroidaceae bacterium]|nr:aminopeptidase P family N-terminal domain-containing protein [Bacteroidaceae bacterium]
MKKNEIDAFVVPSTDPHDGEYVPQHWEARKWISGFTGSAGTFVITISNAAVWTDSRYFIQAEQQLKGTGIRLMKAGLDSTPTIAEYLAKELKPGSNVGFDGWCCTSCDFIPSSLNAVATSDPFDTIWEGRPELPLDQVVIQPLDFAGESAESKISRIRAVLKERGADATVLTRLDDIAWTLNMRGNDVHCNPVFISYLVISQSKANLFVDKRKITGEVESYLAKCGVECYEYADFLKFDFHLPTDRLTSFCLDGSCNYAVRNYITNISANFCLLRGDNSPIVPPMKAVKTKQEQDGFRNAMLRD